MKQLVFIAIFMVTGLCVFAQNAVIERVTGTVEIKQPGEKSFKTANSGDKLFKETVVSTGFKSFAIITIGSTTITARPLTHLSLTEMQSLAETETLNVNLQAGRVRVDVKPPAGTKVATTVNSPTATASVRGTSFEFDTDNLYVSEGTVSFSGNRGQNIYVSAGGSSRVEASGVARTPRDDRIANLLPPSPAGTSAGDSSVPSPVASGVNFSIELDFR